MEISGWQDGAALVARMLRVWRSARSIGENPLPHMLERSAPFEPGPEFVTACDSLFALTEAVLGRPLAPARCCSAALSGDEAALLVMLRHAPAAGSIETTRAVPHGLPAALQWAAFAVVRALGDTFATNRRDTLPEWTPEKCPFGPAIRPAMPSSLRPSVRSSVHRAA